MSDNIYPKPENDLAVKTCVITAAIVSFLGMLDTSLSAVVFWIVGFGCVNYVFQWVKGYWLRMFLRVIAQMVFLALLLWFHGWVRGR